MSVAALFRRLAGATRLGVVLFVCTLSVAACGDDKKAAEPTPKDDATSEPDKPKEPEKPRSALAKDCDTHSDEAKKTNCLCRVDEIATLLGPELTAKLETAPKEGTAATAEEHFGGAANLSKILHAMKKAADKCEQQGASK